MPERLRGAVVAIGNFDGVHQAHKCLLARARAAAARIGAPVMALTFDPHPRIHFNRLQDGWFELTPLPEKIALLQDQGVAVSVLDFNAETAERTARQFIEDILIEVMAAARVIVGDDFTCGRDRVPAEDLVRIARDYQLPVEIMPAVVGRHGRVSSTAIRTAIASGDLDRAVTLLAR